MSARQRRREGVARLASTQAIQRLPPFALCSYPARYLSFALPGAATRTADSEGAVISAVHAAAPDLSAGPMELVESVVGVSEAAATASAQSASPGAGNGAPGARHADEPFVFGATAVNATDGASSVPSERSHGRLRPEVDPPDAAAARSVRTLHPIDPAPVAGPRSEEHVAGSATPSSAASPTGHDVCCAASGAGSADAPAPSRALDAAASPMLRADPSAAVCGASSAIPTLSAPPATAAVARDAPAPSRAFDAAASPMLRAGPSATECGACSAIPTLNAPPATVAVASRGANYATQEDISVARPRWKSRGQRGSASAAALSSAVGAATSPPPGEATATGPPVAASSSHVPSLKEFKRMGVRQTESWLLERPHAVANMLAQRQVDAAQPVPACAPFGATDIDLDCDPTTGRPLKRQGSVTSHAELLQLAVRAAGCDDSGCVDPAWWTNHVDDRVDTTTVSDGSFPGVYENRACHAWWGRGPLDDCPPGSRPVAMVPTDPRLIAFQEGLSGDNRALKKMSDLSKLTI